MPKSEQVANLLNPDDEVEVVIVKAKPKYPNQLFEGKPIVPPLDMTRPIASQENRQKREEQQSKRQLKRQKQAEKEKKQ